MKRFLVPLVLLSGGCWDRGPMIQSAQDRRPAELIVVEDVLVDNPAKETREPEKVGYIKRYRRRLRHGQEVYWITVHDRTHTQVGLVDEGGRTHRWDPGRGAGEGRWVDMGERVLESAIAQLLGISGGFKLAVMDLEKEVVR